MQFLWFEAPEWSVEIGYVDGAGGSVASVSVLIRSPKNPAGIKAAS
jgi:hypothetical protein